MCYSYVHAYEVYSSLIRAFPVILLHYAPNSMHYSQDYSQNHYQTVQ